ncbi:MAG: branched-chain amino acid ABC transporter ATP-binding protein/permease [Alphaproteobacteria bacterium]|nr:branched-chain amino acid ABC transporter ATP-binding protein/permease [Alphaproteobacteria bacterium]
MKIVLAAMAIFIAAFSLDNHYPLLIGQNIFLLAIVAIGLNVLFGWSGQLSIGHAGFLALGAYVSALLALKLKLPLLIGIGAGVMMASAAGLVLGLVALRAKSHYLAMITLAFGVIVEILVQRWVGLTGGSMGLIGVPRLNFGDPARGTQWMFIVTGLAWLAIQAANNRLSVSRIGWGLRAIKESEPAALAVGIDVRVWKAAVFVASAALAGLSGALFAHQSGYVSSDAFGLDKSVSLLIAVVIGGLGLRYGAILGACFVVLIEQALASRFEVSGYLYGGALLAVMLYLPVGLAGLADSLARRRAVRSVDGARSQDVMWSDRDGPPAGSLLLETRQLGKSYEGVVALENVNLRVVAGTVHAVIGPNGAGKSTLVNLLSGMDAPSQGETLYRGQDLAAVPPHRRTRLGMVRTFQNLQLVNELSVIENVMLGLAPPAFGLRGLAAEFGDQLRESRRQHAAAVLRFVEIADLADRKVADLAYGHRKLCELARAIAQSPTLMLLDEPIAGLNEHEAAIVALILRKLKARGATLILIEHNMPFVMAISDRITVLNYGRVIADDEPAVIQRNPAVVAAYLGGAVDTAVP